MSKPETPTGAIEPTDAPEDAVEEGAQPPEPAEEDGGDGDDDDGALSKARKEAAKYRTSLRDTEARLVAAEQSVVDYALASAGLDARLWKAAEVDLDEFRSDTGQLAIAALTERARDLRREFTGGPRPNPQQGRPSEGRGGGLAAAFQNRG